MNQGKEDGEENLYARGKVIINAALQKNKDSTPTGICIQHVQSRSVAIFE